MIKRVAATQNHREHNRDSIQTPFRIKFVREPHIYSKFNDERTNKSKKGSYTNLHSAKNIITKEKLQLNRNSVIIAENSNFKKTITALLSSYEHLSLDTKFDKNKVEISRMKKVMDNFDKFFSYNYMKNLLI